MWPRQGSICKNLNHLVWFAQIVDQWLVTLWKNHAIIQLYHCSIFFYELLCWGTLSFSFRYPWHFMKPLYMCKLDQVTKSFIIGAPREKTDGVVTKTSQTITPQRVPSPGENRGKHLLLKIPMRIQNSRTHSQDIPLNNGKSRICQMRSDFSFLVYNFYNLIKTTKQANDQW